MQVLEKVSCATREQCDFDLRDFTQTSRSSKSLCLLPYFTMYYFYKKSQIHDWNRAFQIIKKSFNKINGFSLDTDERALRAQDPYVPVTIHYIDKDLDN